MNRAKHPTRHIICRFGDKSFPVIDCIGTDNRIDNNHGASFHTNVRRQIIGCVGLSAGGGCSILQGSSGCHSGKI